MSAALILAVIVVFGAIAVLAAYFSRDAVIKRALRKAPRMAVGEVQDGALVKIVGRLDYVGTPLRAPLTGRACAFYSALVEERRSSGKHSRWVRIILEEDVQEFVLRDDTGKALVRARGAQVAVQRDHHQRSGTFDDASPDEEAFLARHGRSSTGLVFNRSLRYTEGALEKGEEVAVFGRARRENDPDPDPGAGGSGYREAPTRLVLEAPGDAPMYASDDPDTLG